MIVIAEAIASDAEARQPSYVIRSLDLRRATVTPGLEVTHHCI